MFVDFRQIVFKTAAPVGVTISCSIFDCDKTNPFKRFEWFYRQRALPYDTIPLQTYITERNREIQKIKEGTLNENQLPWVSVGPKGIQNPNWCHQTVF